MLTPIDSLSQAEMRDLLLQIDTHEDIDVTSWEADFFETAVYRWKGPWSVKQKAVVAQIIKKYQSLL